jgi:hypothetical protein
MNLDETKRADPKPRKDFKNVAIKLPKNSIPEEVVLRPRVNRVDDLNKLADELKSTPTAIVNFLVDVGLECFERSIPRLKDEVKKRVSKKLTKLLK